MIKSQPGDPFTLLSNRQESYSKMQVNGNCHPELNQHIAQVYIRARTCAHIVGGIYVTSGAWDTSLERTPNQEEGIDEGKILSG